MVPHNWVQYWYLLSLMAEKTNLEVGSLMWMFGDAHIYNEPSHIETVKAILDQDEDYWDSFYPKLVGDKVEGKTPAVITTRPKLL